MAGPSLDTIRRLAQLTTATESAHDWLHVLRVESLGEVIAKSEHADEFVVRAAASGSARK